MIVFCGNILRWFLILLVGQVPARVEEYHILDVPCSNRHPAQRPRCRRPPERSAVRSVSARGPRAAAGPGAVTELIGKRMENCWLNMVESQFMWFDMVEYVVEMVEYMVQLVQYMVEYMVQYMAEHMVYDTFRWL